MKIYIAAPWKSRKDMPIISAEVESRGHEITWKWWLVEDTTESERTEEILRDQALKDFHGVYNCDAVLLINSAKSEGKAVEQGIALGLGKDIVVVGKRGEFSQNVFHYLSDYQWNDTLEGALECLTTLGATATQRPKPSTTS